MLTTLSSISLYFYNYSNTHSLDLSLTFNIDLASLFRGYQIKDIKKPPVGGFHASALMNLSNLHFQKICE